MVACPAVEWFPEWFQNGFVSVVTSVEKGFGILQEELQLTSEKSEKWLWKWSGKRSKWLEFATFPLFKGRWFFDLTNAVVSSWESGGKQSDSGCNWEGKMPIPFNGRHLYPQCHNGNTTSGEVEGSCYHFFLLP